MIVDFAFSTEGFSILQKFAEKFDCAFQIDQPSGDALLLGIGNDSYRIKPDESVENFKAAITESLKSGKNLLLEKYKSEKIKYNGDAIY